MSAYAILYNLLSTNAPTTGVVGLNIYPMQAPQDTQFPFIVTDVISTKPTNTKGSNGASSMDILNVQVTMLAITQAQTETLGQYVRSCLDYVWQQTISGVYVQSITFQSENDAFDNISSQDGVYLKYQTYNLIISR